MKQLSSCPVRKPKMTNYNYVRLVGKLTGGEVMLCLDHGGIMISTNISNTKAKKYGEE
ncbi:hypothetical protein D3C81_1122230 [compost metagenome]